MIRHHELLRGALRRETAREIMSENRGFFSKFATCVADISGKPATFAAAVVLVLAWAAAGPFFGFSDTWELVINTGTTIITFLMVFVLQNSQNRDGKAVQAKLDELILTSKAQNMYVGIEKLDEEQIRDLSTALGQKAQASASQANIDQSSSSGST